MKNKALSLALVLTALTAPIFTKPARAEVEVSFDYFYDALSPFGDWIEVGDYGLCWRPTGVGEDWSPYSDGYWAYTDAGWTWVSYEDWGGITYHYGRWVHVRDEGWVWVPDYDWGPAWVSWRSNDDYVGWAPLPPEARWEQETGFSVWVDTNYDIGPDNYHFCHTQDFGSPFLAPVLLPCERNVTIIENTVNVTNICYNHSNSFIFCGGPNFVTINQHCRRPVPALRLVCEDRAVRDVHGHAPPQVLRGNQLAVFAPKVTPPVDIKTLPIKPRRIITADKINRGWGRVPDVAAQQEIRKKLGAQSAGLTPATAPARPPKAEELSSIPKKADPGAPTPGALGRNKPPRGQDSTVSTPQVSPRLGERIAPKHPKPVVDPGPDTNPGGPTPKVPQVSVREQPRTERPANPVKPFLQPQSQPQPVRKNQHPPQTDAAPSTPGQPQTAEVDENARAADKALRRQQREQQAAAQARENAQRSAEIRQQQPQAPRPQMQQADTARQHQEAAQRANELRAQQAQQQHQQARQAETARQNQEAAQRANELRSQQVQQQHQQARQADAMRQQQESAQRSNELRVQQAQQQQQQARQIEAARQHRETAQHANEARHQQAQQPQQPQPPPRQAQQSAPSGGSSNKEGDDEKKKHHGR